MLVSRPRLPRSPSNLATGWEPTHARSLRRRCGAVSQAASAPLRRIAIAEGDPAEGVQMNARTLVIPAAAIAALAAPAVGSAKLSPAWQHQKNLAAKKHAAKHGAKVFKRQGQSRQIYTYAPAPAYAEKTLAELQAEYDAELIGWSVLDPASFADTETTSDTSSSAPAADTSSLIDSSIVDNSDDC